MGEIAKAVTAADIIAAAARLRRAHLEALAGVTVDRVVDALAEVRRRWLDKEPGAPHRARELTGLYGYAGVEVSLSALLESLSPENLNALIDSERVRDRGGFPVTGHIIAGNTPLLAWTSMIRALLVRSASLVKLPTTEIAEGQGSPAVWAQLFVDSLAEVDPPLAGTIELLTWPGQDQELNGALCNAVDLVVAYGSDETVESLRQLRGGLPFLGYGHRLSFGLVMADADLASAADGFALDVLLYDQGGCLSPQSIYVIGDVDRASQFAEMLAGALGRRQAEVPAAERTEAAAVAIARAKGLARMDGCRVWEDPALRWTVILRDSHEFAASPTYGVVSVQRQPNGNLSGALSSVIGVLQGCGVATSQPISSMGHFADQLYSHGVTYICEPGRMQAPPLSWREDNRSVLLSLIP
jgi:acyl-CoA reductase-like NAD-dependent aldehyde dehydrogenase